MSCNHAETTTVLWLHGELEPEREERHLAHVADCPDCQRVIEVEESVLAAVAPVSPLLASAPELPPPANRLGAWPWVAGMVGAAAILLVLARPVAPVEPHDTDLAAAPVRGAALVDPPLFGEVDAGLEALDLELAELSFDMQDL